jgi:ribosomal protein S27E
MNEMRTFKCLNCGATLATSAAPGTTINCEYCGTPFTVPAEGGQAMDSQATVIASFARRGNPSPMPPMGPEGEAPPTPEQPPAPDSPAGVGYTVDADAAHPQVERGPVEPEIGTPIPSGAEIPLPPTEAASAGPSAADIIAEPTKYGAAIPAQEGEVIVVPPNRIEVVPPQRPAAGGPPGATMRRSRAMPLLIGGLVLLCCVLPVCGLLAWGALSVLPNLLSR